MAQVRIALKEARQLVPNPTKKRQLVKEDGNVRDIIKAILEADVVTGRQVERLAARLKGSTGEESLQNAWAFIKQNIKYVNDPAGRELILTPAVTVARGEGDCEDYSLLLAGLCKAWNIPAVFRFAGYASTTPQHVYIVATVGTTVYVVDGCMGSFNKEKPYKAFEDHAVTPLNASVAGIMMPVRTGGYLKQHGRLSLGDVDGIGDLTDGELDLHIARGRFQLERDRLSRIHGIGDARVQVKQDAIDMLEEALQNVGSEEELTKVRNQWEAGAFNTTALLIEREIIPSTSVPTLSGTRIVMISGTEIGAVRSERKAARKAKRKETRAQNGGKSKAGAFLQKAGKAVAKGAKALTKVITATQRLAAKGLLEVTLPKAAPAFLYLFIPEEKAGNLPAKVKKKRDSAKKFRGFVVNTVGMKERHFMGIVQNGIQKRYGMSPGAVIQRTLPSIAGIGVVPIAAAKESMSAIMEIIKLIAGAFGVKFGDKAEPMEPDSADTAGATAEETSALRDGARSATDYADSDEDKNTQTTRKGWCG